jgi:hypothetical protein
MDASLWARHPTKHYTNGSNSPTVYFDEEFNRGDFRFWHEADMFFDLSDVCFWG